MKFLFCRGIGLFLYSHFIYCPDKIKTSLATTNLKLYEKLYTIPLSRDIA